MASYGGVSREQWNIFCGNYMEIISFHSLLNTSKISSETSSWFPCAFPRLCFVGFALRGPVCAPETSCHGACAGYVGQCLLCSAAAMHRGAMPCFREISFAFVDLFQGFAACDRSDEAGCSKGQGPGLPEAGLKHSGSLAAQAGLGPRSGAQIQGGTELRFS